MKTTHNTCSRDTQKTSHKQSENCLLSRMQDGRSFTDYRPRCAIQYELKNNESTRQSSYESRQFLTKNASLLMEMNNTIAEKHNACPGSIMNSKNDTMLPEKNFVKCNKHTCNFDNNRNINGLGTGRIYN
jgi:tRNA(Ile)-lysidine synthase TilS/MesJ